MRRFVIKLVGDKREWRAMEARAAALPRDHRIVYGEVKSHLWKVATGSGADVIAALQAVLGALEAGARQGRTVADVTGGDVAAFCQVHLRAATGHQDRWGAALNRAVARELAR